jgi:hypothetical protein
MGTEMTDSRSGGSSKTGIYQSSIFDSFQTQIRILKLLHSSTENSQIQCQLRIANLNPKNPPSYIALSYTWGDETKKSEILIDGQGFQATVNLVAALRHLRHAQEDIELWVDAVCIDQGDIEERNSQVKMMRDIFTCAKETRAWLGTEGEKSDKAIELVEVLSKMRPGASGNENMKGQGALSEVSSELVSVLKREEDLVALYDLLARGYWYRCVSARFFLISEVYMFWY